MSGEQEKLIRLVEQRLDFCLEAKADRVEEAMVVLMAYSGFSVDKSREYASSHAHDSAALV